MTEVNDLAPSANVKLVFEDDINKDVDLSDLYTKGTIVLYFFPLAFTGQCTATNCSLRDDMAEFGELGTSVYGISVDSPFVLKEFAAKNGLNYPLLSDFNKGASKAFGAQYEQLGGLYGVAKRSLFVVKDGKVTYKWHTDTASDFPPFEELKEHLKGL